MKKKKLSELSELSDSKIEQIYKMICDYYNKHLKKHGVKLPKLKDKKGNYIKEALVLVYLARGYPETKVVSKSELTGFIRKYYPDVNDVQQARHLASQKGWYIISGTRGNSEVGWGEYKLVSLEESYPGFKSQKRKEGDIDWNQIKKEYKNRCATCGSEEDKPNIHWTNSLTKLQKAHRDPRKPLTYKNIIPQCQFCNRAYRNYWVFDNKGRVRKIANPEVVLRSDEEIQRRIYDILRRKFEGESKREDKKL